MLRRLQNFIKVTDRDYANCAYIERLPGHPDFVETCPKTGAVLHPNDQVAAGGAVVSKTTAVEAGPEKPTYQDLLAKLQKDQVEGKKPDPQCLTALIEASQHKEAIPISKLTELPLGKGRPPACACKASTRLVSSDDESNNSTEGGGGSDMEDSTPEATAKQATAKQATAKQLETTAQPTQQMSTPKKNLTKEFASHDLQDTNDLDQLPLSPFMKGVSTRDMYLGLDSLSSILNLCARFATPQIEQ